MNAYPAEAPDPVKRPLVVQRWEKLTFVHYRYEPAAVQAILPDGLAVDTFDGSAWVGLVPFKMVRVRPPGLPAIPWLTTFPETNIRTYVKDRRGGRGVYFSSLEIPRLLGVAVARLFFGVPYTWASMSIHPCVAGTHYESSRLWPSPKGARSLVDVRVGEPAEPAPLLDFLTNRWRAYARFLGRIVYAPVSHQPWQLHEAETTALTDELVTAAGYPAPSGPSLVHYAEGVDARVGRIRRP